MKKTNVSDKYTTLYYHLSIGLTGVNKSRINLICFFLQALCKVQTVTFSKLANAFDSPSKTDSSLRRIQRFMASYSLNTDLVAKFIFSLLPSKTNLVLSIDRTNWKFGTTNINIFMLGICYKGVAFPLMFTMLDKQGNSNSQERIDLVKRFVRLFGKSCIQSLVADREFVGQKWVNYLNNEGIRYHIRIRNNFKVFLPHKQKEIKVFWLFNHLKKGEFKHCNKIVQINNELCYISGSRLAKGEFLILISFNKNDQSNIEYKKRWQIEMCFKAMKSSGFDIEKTHLNQIDRIEKLVCLVMIAFVWCYKVGIYLDKFILPIKLKKHGRKAKTIFKYGLDKINNTLLNSEIQKDIDIYQFLSCT